MNKKGLTLLELLAVIVVLAIIALIATPIVIRTINDSKNNATLRGAENYIREIEYSVAQGILNKIKLEDGTYRIMKSGNICLGIYEENVCSGSVLELEIENEIPFDGTLTIVEGRINSYRFIYKSGIIIANGKIEVGS